MRMPFQGRYERARKLQKERRAMHDMMQERAPVDEMEKGDGCAMLLAAFLTFVPICLVIVALLAAAGYFFLIR